MPDSSNLPVAAPPAGQAAPQAAPLGLEALAAAREDKRIRQGTLAARRERWIRRNRYYYRSVTRLLGFIIEPDRSVLNVRCQTGHFLKALAPSRGVGVEISREMVDLAKDLHPEFEYIRSDPEDLDLKEKFDYVLFNEIDDTVDVQRALERIKAACAPHTRLVIYTYNHLWEPVLKLAERLRLKMPTSAPNWLSEPDIEELLDLAGFERLYTYRIMAFPKWLPGFSWFINRVVARLPGFRWTCLAKVLVARPLPAPRTATVSVIIPCKNEKGNIGPAVRRIPEMGGRTEIIFCDDKSTDGTADEVRAMQAAHPDRDIRLVQGPGICKSENVWTGFAAAKGDVLMILDGDLTVMPEELPNFYKAIVDGKGEFINGSRMVYPMPEAAMKASNMAGNKFFSQMFSFMLDSRIKDTLCGTKVLWRRDWERIKPLVGTWGVKDRWGDYDLLLGAARRHLKIIDLPVHYQERLYGTTKMVRVFRNGLRMLRICASAWVRLKGGY
jgi:SAM-dependent methyltransferase